MSLRYIPKRRSLFHLPSLLFFASIQQHKRINQSVFVLPSTAYPNHIIWDSRCSPSPSPASNTTSFIPLQLGSLPVATSKLSSAEGSNPIVSYWHIRSSRLLVNSFVNRRTSTCCRLDGALPMCETDIYTLRFTVE